MTLQKTGGASPQVSLVDRAALSAALLHPLPSLGTAVAAAVLFYVLRPSSSADVVLTRAALPMLLAQFSISALNDWADRAGDRLSQKQRPVALRMVSPAQAMVVAVICAAAGLALSLMYDGGRLTVLLGMCLLAGWCYDLLLKPTAYSFIPFAVAFPLMLLWDTWLAGRGPGPGPIFVCGVPLAVAIHLSDSIPDREQDRTAGRPTLAARVPGSVAVRLAAVMVGIGAAAVSWQLFAYPGLALVCLGLGLSAAAMYLAWQLRWVIPAASFALALSWMAAGGFR